MKQIKELENKYLFLKNINTKYNELRIEVDNIYKEYTDLYGEGCCISNRSAFFLLVLCKELKFNNILEMGVGLSSYIFRYYKKKYNNKCTITSVDTAPKWINNIRTYLINHNLDIDKIYGYQYFMNTRLYLNSYDLIFQDSSIKVRYDDFEWVLKHNNMIVMDDLHNKHLLNIVEKSTNRKVYDLSKYTLDRWKRFMGLLDKV